MIDYEVGEIPSRNLALQVKDENDNAVNTIGYSVVGLDILGSDNERVDLTGVRVEALPNVMGRYVVIWPKNRSLFNKKGTYLLRLVLQKNDGSKDITRSAAIRVREFGRIK